MSQFTKNILYLILSTALGIGMMYWLYRGFQVQMLAEFFGQRSNYVWITLTLLVGIAANVLRALRWRLLLKGAAIRISRRRSVELVFITYLINSVTPRLGEIVRSMLVKRGNEVMTARALGTVVVEKAADVVCLIFLILFACLARWSAMSDLMEGLVRRFSLAGGLRPWLYAAIVIAVVLALCFSRRLHGRLRRIVHNLWQGICAILQLRRPSSFVLLCLGIWACNFLQLYLLRPCFDELGGLSWVDLIPVFAAGSIGALLPTPSGAGPWHYAIVKMLHGVYGVVRPVAQSFALISHGLKTALVMLLGLLGYATYYSAVWARWRKLRRR